MGKTIKKAKTILFSTLILILFCGMLFAFSPVIVNALVNAGSFSQEQITNPDVFFSPNEQWINVSVNITRTPTGPPSGSVQWVKANFSAINSTACDGDGYLNLTLVDGLWIGNCSVSSFFTNASQTTPVSGQITFVANDTDEISDETQAASAAPLTILMHNLGVPEIGQACMRFGQDTTNMSIVLDFSAVNFVIDVEINMTCLTSAAVNNTGNEYARAALINLTSINMNNETIGTRLAALGSAIQINITNPRTFGPSRIYVNSTAFAELNSNATVTIYGLPFASIPNVTGDNSANLNSTSISWASNGFDASRGVSTGNLTFNVFGFSGYNATDSVNPIININTPITNLSSGTNVLVNVTVNGTGTEPSFISVTLNASLSYNYTALGTNTAGCTNISADGETYNCLFLTNLSDTTYTMTVTAYDYGGTSGNTATNASTFLVDTINPQILITSPTANANLTSIPVEINYTLTETNLKTCWWTNNSGVTNTTTSCTQGANNLTYSASEGQNNITIYSNDSVGRVNASSVTIYVDSVPPTADFGTGTETNNANLSRNNTVINVTSTASGLAALANVTINLLNSAMVTVNSTTTISSPNFVNITNLADGVYYFSGTATDYFGGSNSTSSYKVVIDTTAPVLDLSASSTASDSLTIAISATDTTGLNGTCTTNRGSVSGTTITASDLECGTDYPFTVMCYDYVGFNSSVSETFTTSACQSGGGNGGGASTTENWKNTFTLTNDQFQAGYSKSLEENERLKFNINYQGHYVGLKQINGNTATIIVASTPQEATLNVGESEKFDITEDNYYDIMVTLNSITGGKADVTLEPIHEAVPSELDTTPSSETGIGTQETTPSEEATTGEKASYLKYYITAIILIIAIFVIFYIVKIKKR